MFEAAVEKAKAAGLVGRRRVLDSRGLYDAVATQDTVTMIRSAIRLLLQAADEALATTLGAALKRDGDYELRASPRATGTMQRPARPWSTRWPEMAMRW